mgnify:CR=1 FL=1
MSALLGVCLPLLFWRVDAKFDGNVQDLIEDWGSIYHITTKPNMSDDYLDILGESLEFLGGKPVVEDDAEVQYGPIVLSIAPKVWSSFPPTHFSSG